jgi:hypothetical protein
MVATTTTTTKVRKKERVYIALKIGFTNLFIS